MSGPDAVSHTSDVRIHYRSDTLRRRNISSARRRSIRRATTAREIVQDFRRESGEKTIKRTSGLFSLFLAVSRWSFRNIGSHEETNI